MDISRKKSADPRQVSPKKDAKRPNVSELDLRQSKWLKTVLD